MSQHMQILLVIFKPFEAYAKVPLNTIYGVVTF